MKVRSYLNNKKLLYRKTLSLLAVLIVMVAIFLFSAQKGEESAKLSGGITSAVLKLFFPDMDSMDPVKVLGIKTKISYLVRKTAHFSEYALLGLTLGNFCYQFNFEHRNLISWSVGTLYAGSDEFHQNFVSGRGPSVKDVCIDSAGVLFGILIVFGLIRWIIKRKCEINE